MLKISKTLEFTEQGIESEEIKSEDFPSDWPVVYIIFNEKTKKIYVGETTRFKKRLKEHLYSKRKEVTHLTHFLIITHEKFNKSVILDIEASLLNFIDSDRTFQLLNSNIYGNSHNYFNKDSYAKIFELIWDSLLKRKLISQNYKTLESTAMFKYSPFKKLTDKQEEIATSILKGILNKKSEQTKLFLVQGGAGTGKTVLITYLMKLLKTNFLDGKIGNFENENNEIIEILKKLKFHNKKIALVIPRGGLRSTLRKVFAKVVGLQAKIVIGPHELGNADDQFDLVLVDEAHRLCTRINNISPKNYDEVNNKLNLKNGSQLDWIKKKSKCSILFYDKTQTIYPSDIETNIFESLENTLGSEQKFNLDKQLRVKGGEQYIEFINELLNDESNNQLKKSKSTFNKKYDFRLYSDIKKLRADILKKSEQEEFKLSRLIAGWSWEYKTRKDPKKRYDFIIEGEKFKWDSPVEDWINSVDSPNEVGCVHNVQGYDLNYAGVIFGKEISYNPDTEKIVINRDEYWDENGKKSLKDDEKLKAYIINIYKILLTRGINGTYIYIDDSNLRKYFQKKIG
jgi:hypothetical protein